MCGDEFEAADGRLVTFAERDDDRQWRERAAAERMVGHPPNLEWFCARHADAAAALAEATVDVALSELAAVRERLIEVAIPPTTIELIRGLLADLMPTIVGDADALPSTTSRRSWSPMDGAQPPYCPFDVVDVTTMTGPKATAVLTWDRAMWNDDDPARLTVRLTVTPAGAEEYSVNATVGPGFEGSIGLAATRLLVLGAVGPELCALMDELAG